MTGFEAFNGNEKKSENVVLRKKSLIGVESTVSPTHLLLTVLEKARGFGKVSHPLHLGLESEFSPFKAKNLILKTMEKKI